MPGRLITAGSETPGTIPTIMKIYFWLLDFRILEAVIELFIGHDSFRLSSLLRLPCATFDLSGDQPLALQSST